MVVTVREPNGRFWASLSVWQHGKSCMLWDIRAYYLDILFFMFLALISTFLMVFSPIWKFLMVSISL